MKLKSILFGLSIMAISANAGFFDHDKAYYDKHPEEAQSKFKLCDKAVKPRSKCPKSLRLKCPIVFLK